MMTQKGYPYIKLFCIFRE